MKAKLHLVVALPSEARPLLDAFSMRADDERSGVRLYAGETARLVVTGVGKAASASGVGYLAGAFPGPAIWLNVGIAGHRSRPVGEVLMAHAVVDRAAGQSFFPPLVVAPPVPTSRLVTVDRPETAYAEDAAYDMEAAAFFAAARRFQTAELVHSLKVVSDGPEAPIASITRQRITAWIEKAVPVVSRLHGLLEPLADELDGAGAPPPGEDELLGRWHFSVSDRRALRRELLRSKALGAVIPAELFAGARRGREVVVRLRERLDALATGTGSET